MSSKIEFQYQVFLGKELFSNTLYAAVSGSVTALSLLSALIEPNLPIISLLVTTSGVLMTMEAAVLRFPPFLRPTFRRWFRQYRNMYDQTPRIKALNLYDLPISPSNILKNLNKMKDEQCTEEDFRNISDTIDIAIAKTERKFQILQYAETEQEKKLAIDDIVNDKNIVDGAVGSYIDIMRTVYGM